MVMTPASAPAKSDQDFVPLVRVLLGAFRAAEHAAVDTLRESGLTVAGPAAWNLLRALPEKGTRASHLARELGVSKQAIGQTVRDLERAGLVMRRKDPSDRRALVLVATDAGRAAAATGEKALRAQEEKFATLLGRTRVKALRATLEELEAGLSG